MDTTTIRSLIAQGRFSEALRQCNEVLEKEPDNIEVTAQKAWLLASPIPEVNDPETGIALVKKALEKKPDSAELHLALAYLYEAGMGEYGLASQEYKVVIGLWPEDGKAYLGLALLFEAPGSGISLEQAITYLERGVVIAPSDWQLRRELALLLWRQEDFPRAETEYVAALACEPPPDENSRRQIEGWLRQVRAGVQFKEGFFGVSRS